MREDPKEGGGGAERERLKACFENDMLFTHNFVSEGNVLKIRAVVS